MRGKVGAEARGEGKSGLGSRGVLQTREGPFPYFRLKALEEKGVVGCLDRLPFSIRILLEGTLRACEQGELSPEVVFRLGNWDCRRPEVMEIPFRPARVLMQDFTGLPALVDLAAMRAAIQRWGGNPRLVDTAVPVDLVVDHSLQVDHYGSVEAASRNQELELERNRERYRFLRWAQRSFGRLRLVPPGGGIIHQVNLEFLARVVIVREGMTFPETVVGTDSHTTMINSLGVLGWGVGGTEAEAVLLGESLLIKVPEVVGVRLQGGLREGVTATDLALNMVEELRRKGVVEKFVEFFGPAVPHLSLFDRAVISNMAPEYGATVGFFPIDEQTLHYLRLTNRSPSQVELVERYAKEQGLFYGEGSRDPEYDQVVEVDLDRIEPSLAGPRRPQERIGLSQTGSSLRKLFPLSGAEGSEERLRPASGREKGGSIPAGSVLIAAITSCTNTSHPSLMVGAGILARNAVERGLKVPEWVKTSLAPGSRAVIDYLEASGLLPYLERLGFHLVGYGCTTCIGNSGPLAPAALEARGEGELRGCAVLSGNRNFEGRIHPDLKANYLASPPLVVAYALAGTVDLDLTREPLGLGADGQPVFLQDIWPPRAEIEEVLKAHLGPEVFARTYQAIEKGPPAWEAIPASGGDLFPWDEASTYIQEPPYFLDLPPEPPPLQPLLGARVLAFLGDGVTTDHISPAGRIPADSPAGRYLRELGVQEGDLNTYGSRRGNHRVMTRGTLAHPRLRNLLVPEREGGLTRYFGSPGTEEQMLPAEGEILPIFEAAERYRRDGTPLILIAGREYGTGSSRDWAAKGVALLGVRAVLAASFERIHRSNLVEMGVLPLQFCAGQRAETIGLSGEEVFDLWWDESLRPGQEIRIEARRGSQRLAFNAIARVDTPAEVECLRQGGILPALFRKLMRKEQPCWKE